MRSRLCSLVHPASPLPSSCRMECVRCLTHPIQLLCEQPCACPSRSCHFTHTSLWLLHEHTTVPRQRHHRAMTRRAQQRRPLCPCHQTRRQQHHATHKQWRWTTRAAMPTTTATTTTMVTRRVMTHATTTMTTAHWTTVPVPPDAMTRALLLLAPRLEKPGHGFDEAQAQKSPACNIANIGTLSTNSEDQLMSFFCLSVSPSTQVVWLLNCRFPTTRRLCQLSQKHVEERLAGAQPYESENILV